MKTQSIFDLVKSSQAYNAYNSYAWFQKNVRNIAQGMSTQKYLGDNQNIQASRFLPGQMVQFFYSAKGADKLPYWDTFPLIFPFAKTATHFTGINLHYLHPRLRLVLLDKLMHYATDDALTPKTRIRMNWRLLSNVSKFKEVTPCVKQYIISRVKSKYLIINPEDWPIAAMLPTERFRGAQPMGVFSLSQQAINHKAPNRR